MFRSQLFAGDPLLQAIVDDDPPNQVRISGTQNRFDPAVTKVQIALLTWRSDALPVHGADGEFGGESAGAIRRFKIEELGVPAAQVVNDVGPRSVVRLDEIQAAAEQPPLVGEVVVVTEPEATPDQQARLLAVIAESGGVVELGLGPLAAVVSGGQAVLDAMQGLVEAPDSGVLTTVQPGAAIDALDEDTAELVTAWFGTFDPDFIAAKSDPNREGGSWEALGDCTGGVEE